jgi:hypothetical protein
MIRFVLMFILSFQFNSYGDFVIPAEEDLGDLGTRLVPTILAVFLARNKAHALPYFLGYFERQEYPKDKISVWSVIHLAIYCLLSYLGVN